MIQQDFLVKVDKNGTKYWGNNTCARCGGRGGSDAWKNTGYTCFECGGSGISRTRIWKEYTPEYRAKLNERREKRIAKQVEDRRARAAEITSEYFSSHGFSPAGEAWVILGDTYAERDSFKGAGFKYSPIIGWYADHELKRPCLHMTAEDLFNVDEAGVAISVKDSCYGKVAAANDALRAQESPSEYVGEIGDRIEVEVTVVGKYAFETHVAYRNEVHYIYTMKDASGNVYVWKTGVYIPEGKHNIKGTVKAHSEYKGVKQTVLTRCKIIA